MGPPDLSPWIHRGYLRQWYAQGFLTLRLMFVDLLLEGYGTHRAHEPPVATQRRVNSEVNTKGLSRYPPKQSCAEESHTKRQVSFCVNKIQSVKIDDLES